MVAASMVLLLTIPIIMRGFDTTLRGAQCLAAVTFKTGTTVEGMEGFVNYEGLDSACPKFTVDIYNKKTAIKERDKTIKTIKYDELNSDIVNGIIADELKVCWYEYGEGKLDIFWIPGNWFARLLKGVSADVKGCRVCTEISFDESVPQQTFTGLYEYLQTHEKANQKKVTVTESGTYYKYIAEDDHSCNQDHLNSVEGDNCWEQYAFTNGLKINETRIHTSEKYLVIITRQGVKEGQGTINTYIVDEQAYQNRNFCKTSLPFR